jgi:hypothetical protein
VIVLSADVWPGGDRSRARDMGTVLVWNIGGDADHGEYGYKLLKFNQRKKYEHVLQDPDRIPASACWRAGTIRAFPRQRQGPLDLLYRILHKSIGHRARR